MANYTQFFLMTGKTEDKEKKTSQSTIYMQFSSFKWLDETFELSVSQKVTSEIK